MKPKMEKMEFLKDYYGKVLQGSGDLKTGACCCSDDELSGIPVEVVSKINSEIMTRTYGCGSPIPPAVTGCTILDLGCGTGRDIYIASGLVGPEGSAVGVDMTDEQLALARKHIKSQTANFGYKVPNMDFKKGFIEDLKTIGIEDNSVDVVISNCAINLSPDKNAVFSEIFRVLKTGGELYFSDVFTGRRVPVHLKDDPLLHAECLAGSLYIEDFRRLLREIGCPDHRIVKKRKITIDNHEIEDKIGMVDFYSMTVRAFKLSNLEDICEDYGQTAVYTGSIPGVPHAFVLDDHHRFIAGKTMPVCGNTASMLQDTRFAPHFSVSGDRSIHYGPFDCTPTGGAKEKDDYSAAGSCC
jgi:SAM-dependent methyltransferase